MILIRQSGNPAGLDEKGRRCRRPYSIVPEDGARNVTLENWERDFLRGPLGNDFVRG